MLEVLKSLRQKSFRTYIVTGGGQEFVRVYSEQVYGVPPEQVVGSSIVTKYEVVNGKPELMRESKVFLIDDGPSKRSASTFLLGSRRMRRLAIPVATRRCWNGRKRVTEHG
jgi:hypothetical protein